MPSLFSFNEGQIRSWIETLNFTHADVIQQLRVVHGDQPGLSLASLRRFLKGKNISFRSKVSDAELLQQVENTVAMETSVAGYRSVKASLESRGVRKVDEKRIRRAMRKVDPKGLEARRVQIAKKFGIEAEKNGGGSGDGDTSAGSNGDGNTSAENV